MRNGWQPTFLGWCDCLIRIQRLGTIKWECLGVRQTLQRYSSKFWTWNPCYWLIMHLIPYKIKKWLLNKIICLGVRQTLQRYSSKFWTWNPCYWLIMHLIPYKIKKWLLNKIIWCFNIVNFFVTNNQRK